MPNPGSLSNILPPGDDWMRHKLRDLQRQIDELKTAQPNALASRNFDGTLDPPAAGTQGWGFTAAGDAILNNLILRGGIIGDDALTNPVSPAAGHTDRSNFAITTTQTTYVTMTITVPSGFTSALVIASAVSSGVNSTGSLDFLEIFADIDGANTGFVPGGSADPGGGTANSVHVGTAVLTGLSGTFPIRGKLNTAFGNWSASAGTFINLDALVLFLR